MHSSHTGWSSPTGSHSGDPATRPAISRAPTFTHHALVLGDRHDRSVLVEGGPQKAQTGPVDEGGAVNVRLAARTGRDGNR